MPYQLFITSAGQRSLRKLPSDVHKHLFDELQQLKTHPVQGEQLKGKYRFLRSLHTRFNNIEYRAIYQLIEKKREVIILYVATRENFYRNVEKLRLKQTT
jgi:mRNA-degrading endonuclease RelE of RelBE toxin-antitoxin system